MLIQTKFIGQVSIEEQEIINFVNGLPGFETIKKFVVLPLEKNSPFAVLQSVEEPEIGFVIVLPFTFKSDYAFDLTEEDKEELSIESSDDLLTYAIVTLKEPFASSTLNLQAPILINHKQKLAKQLVLQDSNAGLLRFPIEGSNL